MTTTERWTTAEAASKQLGISRDAVRTMIRERGELGVREDGGRYKVDTRKLSELVARMAHSITAVAIARRATDILRADDPDRRPVSPSTIVLQMKDPDHFLSAASFQVGNRWHAATTVAHRFLDDVRSGNERILKPRGRAAGRGRTVRAEQPETEVAPVVVPRDNGAAPAGGSSCGDCEFLRAVGGGTFCFVDAKPDDADSPVFGRGVRMGVTSPACRHFNANRAHEAYLRRLDRIAVVIGLLVPGQWSETTNEGNEA